MNSQKIGVVDQVLDQLIEVDNLLIQAATQGRDLSYGERLTASRFFDEKTLQRNISRTQRVARALQVAGSRDDRKDLVKSLTDARNQFEKNGPVIRQQIETLEKQLRQLETGVTTLERRQEGINTAIKQLRNDAPEFATEAADTATHALKQSLGREILDLESRQSYLKILLAKPSPVEHWRREYRESCQQLPNGSLKLDESFVAAKSVELLAELESIEMKLSELRPIFDDELQTAEASRDYYLESRD
jgi:exonuclease VII small subunit